MLTAGLLLFLASSPQADDRALGCTSIDGDAQDELDFSRDRPQWSAILRFDEPWLSGSLKYRSGREAVHVWKADERWQFLARSPSGLPVSIGQSDGASPTGRWYFFGPSGLPRWVVERSGGSWVVVASPCKDAARAELANRQQEWRFNCVNVGGTAHGISEVRNSLGVVLRIGQVVEGKKDGSWLAAYDSGCRLSQYHYEKDILNGPAIEWAYNGAVLRRGRYENGRKIGLWEGAPCGDWRTLTYGAATDGSDRCFP